MVPIIGVSAMRLQEIDREEFESIVAGCRQPWLVAARDRVCEPVDSAPSRILVAVDEGRMCAVLGLDLPGGTGGSPNSATIRVLEVNPEHERWGIGARLIRFAEGIARVKGCARVHVASGLERRGQGRCWTSLGYDDHGPELAKDITPFMQRGFA
jgi:GNAT superfamily N-acetyltransferase